MHADMRASADVQPGNKSPMKYEAFQMTVELSRMIGGNLGVLFTVNPRTMGSFEDRLPISDKPPCAFLFLFDNSLGQLLRIN